MKHISGQYYHIYNRGVEKRNIFACDENYHYHFLVRAAEDDGVSPFLQRLFNSYTQAFNKQEKRSGTLFESRAKSVLIDANSYLFHMARYIHLNPVRAGLT